MKRNDEPVERNGEPAKRNGESVTGAETSGSQSRRAGRGERVRRRRGARESLGAVVLGFESIVVFLAGLVIFGLNEVPAGIAPWWGIVAGAVMAVLMILVSAMLRFPWAIVLGWLLQLIVVSAGFLVPAAALVGLIFGGMWGYATIKGAALDRVNAQRAAEADRTDEPRSETE